MERTQDDLDKLENEALNTRSKPGRPTAGRGSFLEHLLYGIGTGVITIVPLLIPGVTMTEWIIVLFGSVMCIYTVICLLGIWKSTNKASRLQRMNRNKWRRKQIRHF